MKPFALLGLLLLCIFVKKSVQQSGQHIAEGYFVVDSKALDAYRRESSSSHVNVRFLDARREAQKDVDYFITQINSNLATMGAYGLNLQIKVIKVDFMTGDLFQNGVRNGKEISQYDALNSFTQWVNSTRAYQTHNYDFAILWTGYDMDYGFKTFSHIGRMCQQFGVGVVNFNGTYEVARVTAHAIANLLGASRDGFASNNTMAWISSPSQGKRWAFSESSVTDIKQFMVAKGSRLRCLKQTRGDVITPNVAVADYEGGLYNYDRVCQRRMNDPNSYVCRSTSVFSGALSGDNVCTRIYCKINNVPLCISTYATDGFICAQGKRCRTGRCVPDSSPEAQAADTSCLFGDQRRVSFSNPRYSGSCQGFVARYGEGYCYNEVFYRHCCTTCNNEESGISGCPWGDRFSRCASYSKSLICSARYRHLCCDYCKGYSNGRRRRDAEGEEEAAGEEISEVVDSFSSVAADDDDDDSVDPEPEDVQSD